VTASLVPGARVRARVNQPDFGRGTIAAIAPYLDFHVLTITTDDGRTLRVTDDSVRPLTHTP